MASAWGRVLPFMYLDKSRQAIRGGARPNEKVKLPSIFGALNLPVAFICYVLMFISCPIF